MSLIDKIQYPTTVLDRRLYEAVFDNILGDTSCISDESLTNLLLQNPEIKCRGCGATFTRDLIYDNPLEEIILFMKRPENFYYTCRWLFNVELVPFQLMILQELWTKKFPMLLMSRGGSKSFLLSVYAMLRAMFETNCKVILAGAAFRQSKLVFEYMENIWRQSPILRNIVGVGRGEGPRRDIDRCNFFIFGSEVQAIPIGDGCLKSLTPLTLRHGFRMLGQLKQDSRVRGQASNYIVCDEAAVWGNRQFSQFDEIYDNGFKPIKNIITKKGFELGGTYNHKIKVLRNHKIEWCRFDELKIGEYVLIDRSERWHDGDFQCTEDQAYTLGYLIGNGHWTNQYRIGVATIDEEVIPILNRGTNMEFKSYGEDHIHYVASGKPERSKWRKFWNLKVSYALNKELPDSILSSNKQMMAACMRGLFDSDGTVQIYTQKGGTAISVSFSSISERLVKQIQYILLHYGIISCVSSRVRDPANPRVWELLITGQNSIKFAKEIGFGICRKNSILQVAVSQKIRTTQVDDIIPYVRDEMLRIANTNKTPRGQNTDSGVSRHKILDRKEMTVEFIQRFISKYKYTEDPFIETLSTLCNPDIFYDVVTDISDDQDYTYDIHVPETHEYCANGFYSHNTKIRGLRSNYTICDEAAAILQNPEVFEVVIRGFSSVSKSPDMNVANNARVDILRQMGMSQEADDAEEAIGFGNQIVISGTAYYTFNRLYDYYKRYNAIIESQGDTNKLEEIFLGAVPDGFDWTQYSVITIPFDMLPKGFMDEDLVAQAKATFHTASYLMEYKTCFVGDSSGFFKRSLIESCVCNKPINLPSGPVTFQAVTCGNPNKKYIMGVDPASETDNFSVVVLEIHEDHRRIVYAWSITREKLRERLAKRGSVGQKSFYSYCARKIRDISKMFPCEHIGIDGQGGGIAIMEALHDPDELQPGELPIWPYIKQGDNDVYWWEEAKKPTDSEVGLHTLHVVQFVNPKFTSDANHGLRKDFESKIVLLPHFDTASIGMACEADKAHDREYDTLEDCVMEIEALKDELTTIIHEQTITGRDRWDTPAIKRAGNKVGRLRKDRYTALTIANLIARVSVATVLVGFQYKPIGGYVSSSSIVKKDGPSGSMYIGPDHIISKMTGTYGIGVRR